jgi:respiratory burst oxidase
MIATAIVVGITLHAGNHLACDFPRVIAASPEEYALVAGAFGLGKPTYAGLLSGAEGVTGVAMVVLMTVSFTLATHPFRKGEPKGAGGGAAAVTSRLPAPLNRLTGFNAFWYSHHLLGIVYALLLVHGYFLFLVRRWYEKTVRAHAHILLFFFFSNTFFVCLLFFLNRGTTCLFVEIETPIDGSRPVRARDYSTAGDCECGRVTVFCWAACRKGKA